MAEQTQLDVLAIFSHPDDAELTVAGTLLKLKALGYRAGIADMTRGEMGTRGTPEIRAKEALDAARVMNLDARVNLALRDGHLTLNEDNKLAVVRVLRKYRPRVVFTAHWDDPHPDHAATAHIVREAARLATMRRYDKDSGGEAIKMPAVAHAVYSRLVVPAVVLDHAEFADKEIKTSSADGIQFVPAG